MTWVKIATKNYKEAGLKKPVFLWDNLNSKRIFIDIEKGALVNVQYTFDGIKKNEENNAYVKWHNYEAGVLDNDFAFEIIGITAVRLNIKNLNKSSRNKKVLLDVYEFKQ